MMLFLSVLIGEGVDVILYVDCPVIDRRQRSLTEEWVHSMYEY